MQKPYFLLLLAFATLLSSCGSSEPESSEIALNDEPSIVMRDINEIREDGYLTAIAIYNSTSYFLYKGEPLGFEYELLSELAKELKLELRIRVAEDIDDLFTMLNNGEGDIIAYGLSITESRKKLINFTEPHYVTHQALVQRKPDNWRSLPGYKLDDKLIDDPLELIDKTVHVRRNSSYYERLQNLAKEVGGNIDIQTVSGDKTTDEIIKMVVDGEIDYTVSDYNIAALNQTYYPILDVETQISFSQQIAWGVRKNSPLLLQAVNMWLKKIKQKSSYRVLYNKYFKNRKSYQRRIKSDFYSKNSGKISQYDEIIKKHAAPLGWDWRLLSSLIYQESRFEPQATSWAGAGGLMQIMPSTAQDLGLKDISHPDQNIQAGSIYLKKLWNNWKKIPDSVQRTKFVMASYNCGLGHVRDAQRLATAFGENPLLWDDNVEDYVLKLSSREYYTNPVVRYGFVRGLEPYLYVKEIFLRYDHYKKFIPLAEPKKPAVASQ
ncbi:putative soluble lytic transglycosylase fused to an ABC-type amino acid-binding protein [Owenweeksia hongkongensis DSM 17368]|uniref:Putative soluble lytic transglycosylase fused to an ABC-type amino acid-binding protein n=1 Tax=Owenweeksia hongkongensis (strain DSM 17368 / CIP 108786 / JCM 12287 / NRRL B-23963 / UST20020801) TaxID=926562 RepID=G8R270_OWEHD|nr:transporter substrate-binding domain-containing protein [Owenweeksia hongkongensis]AEV31820.1 putative soluble lytic transglycosylase fused to an ABC-type amino acid-binding protein [Owenweeksia hongkongensis DSM 17368]